MNRFTGSGMPQASAASSQDSTFMKSLMNIICITINQTDTSDQTSLWLGRLERFVKLLLIVSETWKVKNETYF